MSPAWTSLAAQSGMDPHCRRRPAGSRRSPRGTTRRPRRWGSPCGYRSRGLRPPRRAGYAGVHGALGNVLIREVGGPHEERIGVGDGLRSEANPEDVADHPRYRCLRRHRGRWRWGDCGSRPSPRGTSRRSGSTSSSNSTMPALSWKTLTHQSLSRSKVALAMVDFRRLSMTSPSISITPRKVLCWQCSLQVWAMVSSSQRLGSRPSAACGPAPPHLGEVEERAPSVERRTRPSSSRPPTGTSTRPWRGRGSGAP